MLKLIVLYAATVLFWLASIFTFAQNTVPSSSGPAVTTFVFGIVFFGVAMAFGVVALSKTIYKFS